jgi:hypothetical protein
MKVYVRCPTYDRQRNEEIRSMVQEEMQDYFDKMKNLMAQEDKSDQHSEKLNYCYGRFEGLQWVLSNIDNGSFSDN